ncbi:MAG TPA: YvcK family protein [Bacillales bacterium]|nr:YvcK family protein [Bacillales bacterium]
MEWRKLPRIVVIGGGTGLPVLLRGLKQYPIDITAIVTVADDGGSSGRLRSELQIPPPGDIRNCLAALSEVEPLIESLFQHRFRNGNELSGHALGNLLLAAMTNITGDFVSGIREMSKVLNVKGKVLPAANRAIILHAELEDGTVVTGESKIPNANKKIKRVFLTPSDVEPLPETLEEINNADLVVIGPGSLYTSILPNLLVSKVGQQLCRSKAKKVYVCNVMTQAGETMGYTASDHVKALYDHLKCAFLNSIIVNDAELPKEVLQRYKLENAQPVKYDKEKLENYGLKIINKDLVQIKNGVIRHDTEKIANVIYSLL